MGKRTTGYNALEERERAAKCGMFFSFLSLGLLDLGYLEWMVNIFAGAADVEPGSGEAQAGQSWVLKWMAFYTAIVVLVIHHVEHTKCRNHSFHPQMCAALPCLVDPCASGSASGSYYNKGGGVAEVYGVPIFHAAGNACLIIAKSYDLGGECPTPPESEFWSHQGAIILAVSGVIADFM